MARLGYSQVNEKDNLGQKQLRQEGFFYTSPLLDCEFEHTYIPPFESELRRFIQAAKDSGWVTNVGIFFKQLNNGYSFGINEHDKFHPASLLKVGNMMWAIKMAERNPEILQQKLLFQFSGGTDSVTNLIPGNEYALWDFLKEMILESDNQAMAAVHTFFGNQYIWRLVFEDMGYRIISNAGNLRIMTPKLYSALFQVLYNATYLSPSNSQSILKLLTNTRFNRGIRAGIKDPLVKVASKYGLHHHSGKKEFHECAIVYLDGAPYLLTVMTEGTEQPELFRTVKHISRIVYENCKSSIANETSFVKRQTQFTNPLLECASTELIGSFRQPLYELVSNLEKENKNSAISVFFRQLSTGRTISINPDAEYNLGALKSVPHVMALFKAGEDSPLLGNELVYLEEESSGNLLKHGNKYTVQQLLELMLKFQDNDVQKLIYSSSLNREEVWNDMLKTLQIKDQWRSNETNSIGTVEQISMFFRVLYNSTYLARENSEVILKLLCTTPQKDGVRKGIGSDDFSALKSTIMESSENGRTNYEVHEGGIVYAEGNPYVLVVMTKGSDVETQTGWIESISKFVYENVTVE